MFATLGLKIANHETEILWRDYVGADPTGRFVSEGFYIAINNYVYGGFRMGLKNSWALTKISLSQVIPMLRGAPERWQEARNKFERVVTDWESKDIANLSNHSGAYIDCASLPNALGHAQHECKRGCLKDVPGTSRSRLGRDDLLDSDRPGNRGTVHLFPILICLSIALLDLNIL